MVKREALRRTDSAHRICLRFQKERKQFVCYSVLTFTQCDLGSPALDCGSLHIECSVRCRGGGGRTLASYAVHCLKGLIGQLNKIVRQTLRRLQT